MVSHLNALISLTKGISKNLDKENIGRVSFVDLKKAFDTAEYDILFARLEHHGIRGIANGWFSYHFSDRKQFVSVNGRVFNEASAKHGVPHGSVLGLLGTLITISILT